MLCDAALMSVAHDVSPMLWTVALVCELPVLRAVALVCVARLVHRVLLWLVCHHDMYRGARVGRMCRTLAHLRV